MRWWRTAAVGFSVLWISQIVWDWSRSFSAHYLSDYLSYWAAGKLTLTGNPAAAYDVDKHRAIEFAISKFPAKLMPFPYPPPFLLVVTPFSLLPYIWGFAVWIAVTLGLYVLLVRKVIDTPYALAHPSVLVNGVIGQNGFLTAAIFTAGTSLLRTRPFVAGAILGAFVIKPQLALLLPVAVIAGRLWSAVAGAVTTAVGLTLLSLILFGAGTFTGFLQILSLYTELMRQETWPWNEFISIFAFLRYCGVDQTVSLTVHAIVAVGAATLTWIAWSRDWKEQVPILAAATLLIPPYLLTYDALLMIIPMGFWIRQQPRPYLVGLLWLLCFLPIAFYFNLYRGPNTVPVAAVLTLASLVWRKRAVAKYHALA